MSNKIYIVRLNGLNTEGEELFCKSNIYEDAESAKKAMDNHTADFKRIVFRYLYPQRISLYVHLIVRELENGEYKYRKSAIYSCCEACETTIYKENPVFAEL